MAKKSKKGISDNTCPYCNLEPVWVSRDLFRQSRCIYDHKWHYCVIHNSINMDWPKSNNLSTCSCPSGKHDESVKIDTKKILEALSLMHSPTDWAFFEELRVGTGFGKDNEQRMDAWAINYFPSKKNVVRCYEVKSSRSDFFVEIQKPQKRKAGLRLSNEFYFVAPKNMLKVHEIPPECGLLEVDENNAITIKIRAPYRNTIPPTFLFLSAICRRIDKQRKDSYENIRDFLVQNKLYSNNAQRIIKEHIQKWSSYNQGNKEVPDKIADAMKMMLSDIEKSSAQLGNIFDSLDTEIK